MFHKWQAESHAQPGSVSGPDETVHVYLIVMMVSSQVESARTYSSAFPIHRSSIRKAEKNSQSEAKISIMIIASP